MPVWHKVFHPHNCTYPSMATSCPCTSTANFLPVHALVLTPFLQLTLFQPLPKPYITLPLHPKLPLPPPGHPSQLFISFHSPAQALSVILVVPRSMPTPPDLSPNPAPIVPPHLASPCSSALQHQPILLHNQHINSSLPTQFFLQFHAPDVPFPIPLTLPPSNLSPTP